MDGETDYKMPKCVICGKFFEDRGSHPSTCGQRECIFKAAQKGWQKLSPNQVKHTESKYGEDFLIVRR